MTPTDVRSASEPKSKETVGYEVWGTARECYPIRQQHPADPKNDGRGTGADRPAQGLRAWFRASPLITVVMVGAAADLSFALDSIPAV